MKEDRNKQASPSTEEITPEECHRDPEDREVRRARIHELREKMMDKTLADSFPSSDPPSSIPNPGEDDSIKKEIAEIEKTSEQLEQDSERLKRETEKLKRQANKKNKAA
jgi:hypothetical protein